ncbi:sigma-70 family RNA polymerase sigma factor [Sphaerisporangium siamense]|uniref:RNA polymerase sigma factor (Sigma-70 family) n=1 Tax=Sphaerisporangium siamense TaxID=795645 RepID=A0A7W7D7K2_9ACTN|nr:sigma-70 family RNA polymerase sigma factor [Sphaerisporangium siamense]MBB4701715.1 RNA polymerase sigma factor (sigma-70 family) [Sphaerisporangium siamense]
MPGWPSAGRADDQRLVEALRRAEGRAADGLYDHYADRLNDYACSLLDDPDAAADAVHDAFVTAHGRADALREPARLRAWLYALTRYQCLARQGRTPAHGTALPDENQEDPELAAIVREALGELGQKDREVLLLGVRHGLTAAEVGAVVGLTSRQTGTRLARARDHLENAAAAVILARTGRAHCPDLSALLDSIDGPLPQPLRRRLVRHIAGCEVCTEGRHRRVSAERLLDTLPVGFPPLSLRRRVAETCGRSERDAAKTAIMPAPGVLDKNGFPPVGPDRRAKGSSASGDTPRHGFRSEDTPERGHAVTARYPVVDGTGGRGRSRAGRRQPGARTGRRAAPIFAALACVLLTTGAMIVITGQDSGHRDGSTTTLRFPSRTPGELQITYAPEPADAVVPEPSSPAPRPSATRTRARAAEAPAASTAAPKPSASRSPSRRPSVPSARLVISCPGALGDEGAGVILISARDGGLSWRATAGKGLTVTPANGVLESGAKARLSVEAADPAQAGRANVVLSSGAGGASCAVSWEGQDMPPASDPPRDDPPTSEPSATDTPSGEPTGGAS